MLRANAEDVADAKARGLSGALVDRLALDEKRIEATAAGLEVVAALEDPVGQVIAEWERPNGLKIARVRVPLGVIGIIYESRPNVTADAAALCLKSGNAAILRGGSESARSSAAIHQCLVRALEKHGLPATAVQMVPTQDRDAVGIMLRDMARYIDVIVPRGGKGLVARVQQDARVPVMSHLEGICHTYIHAGADLAMARRIAVNAKMRRTGICGATETILVDRACAATHLQPIVADLIAAGCEVRGDAATQASDSRVSAAAGFRLGQGVPRRDRRGARDRRPRRGARAHPPLRLGAHRRDRHERRGRGRAVPERARQRDRDAQRVHAVRGRRRVRHGRRDRHRDRQDPRARPGRRRRAHELQVPRARQRPDSSLSPRGSFPATSMSAEGAVVRLPPILVDSSFDLIVIGAGINGAAIAREAALSGVKVLLLERGDVAAGTSSASSRLIHGGLRYLEHAEISLVRESLNERERLLRSAPHLVVPLELYIPVYRRARRKRWQIARGAHALRLVVRGSLAAGAHACCRAPQLLERMPGLNADGLVGGASYYDAQARYPERLVVENVRDAVANGATLEDLHARHAHPRRGGPRDRSRVAYGAGRDAAPRRAPLVVNAAGPWVDEVLGPIKHTRLIGGTKGSHLIAPPFPGAPRAGVYVEAGSDSRPLFILPWNDLLLVGTTDERFDGDAGAAAIDDREFAYLVARDRARVPRGGRARAARALHAHGRAAAAVSAARRRGRDHAAASDPPPSRGARAVLDRRRQAHDASRARGGRAEGAVARPASAPRACARRAIGRCPVRSTRATAIEMLAEIGAALGAAQAQRVCGTSTARAAAAVAKLAKERDLRAPLDASSARARRGARVRAAKRSGPRRSTTSCSGAAWRAWTRISDWPPRSPRRGGSSGSACGTRRARRRSSPTIVLTRCVSALCERADARVLLTQPCPERSAGISM